MSRRSRKANLPDEEKKEIAPLESPALFLTLWLVVPMILMIAYAVRLRW